MLAKLKSAIGTVDDLLLNKSVRRFYYRNKLSQLAAGLEFRFDVHYRKNNADLLSLLCDQHGSDKGEARAGDHPYPWPAHTYADYYSRLYSHCRASVKRVFECGLGTNNPSLQSSMGAHGRPGASLRVWRDYFPNAVVYGADIDRAVLFTEERITTYYIDQLDPRAIGEYWRQVGAVDFDFMIDDGLHTLEAGTCLFTHSIAQLAPNGIYVIEDVVPADLLGYRKFFASTDYLVDYVTMFRPNVLIGGNSLVVVRRR